MNTIDQRIQFAQVIYYPANDLISQDNQHTLIAIRDLLTINYFRAGDIANQEILQNAHRIGITDKMIYDAVGFFIGKSGRTVRYYAENAAFYPLEVRMEYDMLPFSHFDVARNYPIWREVLEIAKTNPGMSHTSLAMYADKFFEKLNVRPPAYENSGVRFPACEESDSCENEPSNDVGEMTEKIIQELAPFRGGRFSAARVIGKLLNVLASLRRLLDECELSEDVKGEMCDHIEALQRLIPRVIGDIEGKKR